MLVLSAPPQGGRQVDSYRPDCRADLIAMPT